jgi:hypothetical protein
MLTHRPPPPLRFSTPITRKEGCLRGAEVTVLPWVDQAVHALPQPLLRSLIEIDALLELLCDAAAELELPVDAELRLEPLEGLQREATPRRRW